jgi:hypothetical protein
MMISNPKEVANVMLNACVSHPEISEVVQTGAGWLTDMYAAGSEEILPRQHAASSLAERFDEDEVRNTLDNWTRVFKEAVQSLQN